MEAKGPDGQPWPGAGRAIFEWHPSKAHLVQRTVIDVADAPGSTSIIGCDAADGPYLQLYSDEPGVCGIYETRISPDEWSLLRDGAPFPQRFMGNMSEDGRTINLTWRT